MRTLAAVLLVVLTACGSRPSGFVADSGVGVLDAGLVDAGTSSDDGGMGTDDAGAAGDAGSAPDDGGTLDGGDGQDAGAPQDAGVPLDGGAEDDAGAPPDGGAEDDAGVSPDAGAGGDAGAPVDAGPPLDAGMAGDAGVTDPCAPGAPTPQSDLNRTLQHQGRTRSYRVHLPPSYAGNPTPLVFNFHGYGSNGSQQEFFSEMTPKADAAGFIVVYPEGTGFPQGWNGGACCGATGAVDDVGFVNRMIDEIAREVCVDSKRVYATGMSNGGFLTHRLACELAGRIAAFAPVAGVIGVSTCTPSRSVSLMHFHGTSDTSVPYEGSTFLGFPSVADTIAGWVQRSGCQSSPTETFRNGDSHCDTYGSCTDGAEITLCTVDGGGHTWPGGAVIPGLGHTTTDLIANDAMWDFFLAHPLP